MRSDLQVSVLMPIYNGEPYLRESISSVLNQKNVSLELIAIDDGSCDGSVCVLQGIDDDRVRVVHQENIGLAATLNKGISLAQSELIARLDQDDLAESGRFAIQVEFMRENPDCAVVGTWAAILEGRSATARAHRHPTSDEGIKLELLFDNPFVHSSVVFRKSSIIEIGGYTLDRNRQPPEDYELWSRVSRRHRMANIPKVLTSYREIPGSMSRVANRPFLRKLVLISSENLASILKDVDREACLVLAVIYHGERREDLCLPSIFSVLALHRKAATLLWESKQAKSPWSAEYIESFKKQRRKLLRNYLILRVPPVVAESLEKIYRKLRAYPVWFG